MMVVPGSKGRWTYQTSLTVQVSRLWRTYTRGNHTKIRVYYQAEDPSLREHYHDKTYGWRPGQPPVQFNLLYLSRICLVKGEWSPGRVRGNPVSAVAFTLGGGGGPQIQVYWRNISDEIVVSKHAGHWTPP